MKTADFNYILPTERIAQEPIQPRDHSRLLVVKRGTLNVEHQPFEHRHFYDIGDYLEPGDLLVVNESKVFKARLMTEDGIELFLLRPEGAHWLALAKPAKRLKSGSVLTFSDGEKATVIEKRQDGTLLVDFGKSAEDVLAWTDKVGSVPVPPYIEATKKNTAEYQTVYAKHVGSVAAPTAGFHFTPELIEKLKAQGVRFATVTLHVGLGTFRPITAENLADHEMHEEWVEIPEETRALMAETRKNNKRIIAVGTTTVRALESETHQSFTKLFITPGYKFKNVDGLITNFHLPKSTLIVLVSAFAGEKNSDSDWGRKTILAAYDEALKNNYRFASFGDAMLIV